MENDQLIQRIEWLDEERRKDKDTFSELQKRVVKLEGALDKVEKENKELSSEVTRLSVLVAKVDGFNDSLEAHRLEVKKELEAQEARRKRRESEQKQIRDVELDNINKALVQNGERITQLTKIEDAMRTRQDEEARIHKSITELRKSMEEIRQGDEERARIIRAVEDGRRQDEKRTNDMQGEVSAMRKRTDEMRARMDLAADNQRKLESRFNDLLASDAERREAQTAFIEKLSLDQLERERTWKEWSTRFEAMEQLSEQLAEQVREIQSSARQLNQAQNDFAEMTEQLGRRTNEITEMQRLGEERFRQDWSAFKADDQKRWTNYTLTQEEQQRELNRAVEKISEQLTNLEDTLQEIQDIVQYNSEQAEKRVAGLLAIVREWAAETERFTSRMR